MTSATIIRRWTMRMLLAAGVVLALVAATPNAEAGFRLSIGTGGFYFSVGHHDYYPYYHRSHHHHGYGAPSFNFHSTLSDYGYWQYSPELGMEVWIPYVDYGWRPYTQGHWTYSPYGWTWVAYEPWGWIPHHYGNWTYVDHYGWAWVPGYTWRPHCVEFAVVNGYIGWAPMAPPWYRYNHHRGYRYHGDRGWYSGWHHGHRHHDYSGIDYNAYVFVDNRHFYGAGVQQHALLPGRGMAMFQAGQVMPLGDSLDLGYVKNVTGRAITPVALDRQVYQVNGSEVVHYQARGQEELVRQAALPTVNNVLAPGFQKHGVQFQGTRARNASQVNNLFKQSGATPKTTVFNKASVSKGMANDPYYKRQKSTLDNLANTRAANNSGSSVTSGRSSKGAAVATSGRTGGFKPRGGVVSGTTSSGKDRAMPSGTSASSGKGRTATRSSTAAPSRTVNKPPRGKPAAPAGPSRTVNKPPRGKPAAPAGPSRTVNKPPRGKPAAPAGPSRTVNKPPRGKPATPAAPRTGSTPKKSSGKSGTSDGKPSGGSNKSGGKGSSRTKR